MLRNEASEIVLLTSQHKWKATNDESELKNTNIEMIFTQESIEESEVQWWIMCTLYQPQYTAWYILEGNIDGHNLY